jgi:hypothetical protein
MHLVGYLYEDCHDARSLEHKLLRYSGLVFGMLPLRFKGQYNISCTAYLGFGVGCLEISHIEICPVLHVF